MKIIVTAHLILIAIASLQGQDTISLRGKIIDAKSGEPLAYASLLIKNTTVGTMANEEGKFVLHLDNKYRDMTLQFAMLGYEAKEMLISEMKKDQTILMNAQPTVLREVLVQALPAEEILRRAFRNKTKNFPTKPFQFEGYYQEIQQEDGREVSFIEAFALVSDEGYHRNNEQKVFLKQLRIAQSYDHPVAPFWENNNLLLAFIGQNFVKYYRTARKFKVKQLDDSSIDGIPVYVLSVSHKHWQWPSLLYVRADDYAIIRSEENYEAERDGPRRWKVEDNPMVESHPQAKTLEINYKLLDGRYYPDNYRMYFKNVYRDIMEKKVILEFEIVQQFVVTRVYINELNSIENETPLTKEIGLKKIEITTDTTFWKFAPIRDTAADSLVRRALSH